ncbi:MAG: Npun_F0296 family exosortase-dependent surface protein [Janthinobacterium lividum]
MRLSIAVLASTLGLLASTLLPISSHADTFSASYLAAGVQTPNGNTNYNTFDSGSFNSANKTTTFNGSSITGTYSGSYNVVSANQYGGAGGSGNFITTTGSYSLSLSSSANYFGLWFSALDNGNQLSFYKDNSLVYSFTPANYKAIVGGCPSSSNAFCGNPTQSFLGKDSGEQFAFLNFYDSNGTFNKVTFTQTLAGAAFESDNHTVALTDQAPLGTNIVTPEPSSWILAMTGIFCIGGVVAVRRMKTVSRFHAS